VKIAHILPTYLPAIRYGGPIRAVHGLCRHLVARGHQVDVFTTNVDGHDNSEPKTKSVKNIDGVTVQYFPVRTPRRLYYSPEMAMALARRASEFDILHLHSMFLYPTLKAARCAEKMQVPYVISPRGMLVKDLVRRKNFLLKHAWIAMFERRTVEQAAAVHVTSAIEAKEIRKFGFVLPRIFEIANGVEIPSVDGVTSRESNTILFLGRLDWKKGIGRLISALDLLKETHLIVAGNDEVGYTPKLMALSEQLGVADRVEFVGPVDGADKWRLYRRASAFVLPSLSENLANTVLEAMALECPVVVTPEVGLAEVVERHGTGIVTGGDPVSLANAIRTILDNPEKAQAMGRKGRAVVEEKFAWTDIVVEMEREYSEIIDEHESRAVA
jgi:glycosyltransferase involved in cell wall biosynthesis